MTTAAPTTMKICVFLSAADLDEHYTRPARELAELLGKGGHTLVWGGSDTGLMKVVADGVRETGGRLVGISVTFLREWARQDADEMVFADDLAERKALLLARADAVVVMAGGLGTLDEVTEILELKKHGLHDKPVVLLNTAGFYDGLTLQLRRMEEEGFLPCPWTSCSSPPTRLPTPSPTWRNPSECGESITAVRPTRPMHRGRVRRRRNGGPLPAQPRSRGLVRFMMPTRAWRAGGRSRASDPGDRPAEAASGPRRPCPTASTLRLENHPAQCVQRTRPRTVRGGRVVHHERVLFGQPPAGLRRLVAELGEPTDCEALPRCRLGDRALRSVWEFEDCLQSGGHAGHADVGALWARAVTSWSRRRR